MFTYAKKTYKSGVKLTVKEMKYYENRIERSSSLPQWDITIEPLTEYVYFFDIHNSLKSIGLGGCPRIEAVTRKKALFPY